MVKKLLILALVLSFAQVLTPAWAVPPSGTISIKLSSLSVIDNMGANWVDGILTFNGKTHPFKIKGLQTSKVGVLKMSIKGEVYNLQAASELAGEYRKAEPSGLPGVAGQKGLVVRNDKGVVIDFKVIHKRLEGKVRTIRDIFSKENVPLQVVPEGMTIDQVR